MEKRSRHYHVPIEKFSIFFWGGGGGLELSCTCIFELLNIFQLCIYRLYTMHSSYSKTLNIG